MHIVMLVLGLLAGCAGGFLFAESQNAIHEIEALLCLVCCFIGVGAFAIANETIALRSELALQGKERRQMAGVAGGLPAAAMVEPGRGA